MSFHGGLLGVIVAMALCARSMKVAYLPLMDFVAPLVPIGLGAGRIGNFINGELWGKPTDVPWAVIVDGVPRHPSQLYEAGLEGLRAVRDPVDVLQPAAAGDGACRGLFLLLYGICPVRGGVRARCPTSRSATSPSAGSRWGSCCRCR